MSRKIQETEHFGLENQEASCMKYAEREGITVYKIIKDGWKTGSNFDRDGLRQCFDIMKENKKSHQITDLICMDQSRLSRNDKLTESLNNAQKIRDYGVKINYVMYPIDSESSMGIFMEQIMYSIASLERRNTAEKSLAGSKRRLNEWHRSFPTVAAGFKRQGTGKEKCIIIDPFKWPILKKALEMYANGVIVSDIGFFKYLKDHGFTSNKGKMMPSILEFMFTEERLQFYAGRIFHSRWGVTSPILGKHPALISLKTMEKIKMRRCLNADIGRTKEDHNSPFPLKWLVSCPACGRKLTAYFSTGKKGIRYGFYGCQNRKCQHRFCINANTFHEDFKQFVDSVKISNGMTKLFKLCINRLWDETQKSEEVRVEELKRKIFEFEEKQKIIVKSIANVTIPEVIADLQKEWNIYSKNKAELAKQLEACNIIEKNTLENLIDSTSSFFTCPQKIFDLGNKDLQKIMLSVLFGKQIFYSKENKARTPEKSSLNLVLTTIWHTQSPVFPYNEKNGMLEHHFSQLVTDLSLDEYASQNII